MSKWVGNLSRKMKIIEKSQMENLELKSIIHYQKWKIHWMIILRPLSTYCTKCREKGNNISNYHYRYVYFLTLVLSYFAL